MAYQDEKSLYSELRPFAEMVIDQGKGVVVADLTFASAEDRYSTCFIPLNGLILPANTPVKFMQKNVGEAGQGFTAALTVGETNNTNGDRQPSNQVYIATHLGFAVYATTGAGSLNILPIQSARSLMQICASTTWSLTVGDGIKRILGTLIEYPAGSGITVNQALATLPSSTVATSVLVESFANNGTVDPQHKRKLPIPIVFPPNIQVDLELKTGSAQTLIDNQPVSAQGLTGGIFLNGGIAFKATFTGFRMTMPT